MRLQSERKLEAKTVETESDAGKLNITLAKLVIGEFPGDAPTLAKVWGALTSGNRERITRIQS